MPGEPYPVAGGAVDSSVSDALISAGISIASTFLSTSTAPASVSSSPVTPTAGVTLPPASGALGTPTTAVAPGSFFDKLTGWQKGLLLGAGVIVGVWLIKKL